MPNAVGERSEVVDELAHRDDSAQALCSDAFGDLAGGFGTKPQVRDRRGTRYGINAARGCFGSPVVGGRSEFGAAAAIGEFSYGGEGIAENPVCKAIEKARLSVCARKLRQAVIVRCFRRADEERLLRCRWLRRACRSSEPQSQIIPFHC